MRQKNNTLDEIMKQLLIPRKSFIKTAFIIAHMPERYLDPLEIERRSGLSRASVYKELKVMSEPPLQWLEKKGERKYVWRKAEIKLQLEKLINELDRIITAIEESKRVIEGHKG